jgi:phosphatidylserine/phosphatidylglycerophosphate/cardiolipin synthase-like enzyme
MSNEIEPSIQLVITAPKPYGAALAYRTSCRTTLGVLVQLLVEAKRYIVIATPFLQSGYGLGGAPLAESLRSALGRGVNVDLLSTEQGLQAIDAGRLRRDAPGRRRLFRAAANLENGQRLGSHAKFCIADGESAYVGSANLTGPGLTDHLEMGLLVRGSMARQIADFWKYSTEVGLFVRVE